MTDLSIIIVSWNVADLLAACLDSILNNTPDSLAVEIIVVDSASSDDTVAQVYDRYPQVKLLPQTDNLGFTRCNNIGLAASSGRYVMLLNPDTEIVGDALALMVDYLDQNADVGLIGPRTLNADGSTQSTRRRFPSLAVLFLESTWLQPFAPRAMLDAYYMADAPDDATFDIDWAQGSALMARRAVYRQIGGLDEGYIMYSEEVDWCKRAKNAGWRVVYLGAARIIHHGGKSSEQVAARSHIHFQQSKLRYTRKYHGRLAAQVLRAFLFLNYGWQLALEAAKGLLGHKRDLRRARVRAYWQVIRSGLKVS
ncbi:MAG: glycosyltransferase family 2 protein [Chloroflexi bacterium]|nr:glycosyltransferase family 2 protein [Chloroflexota bacterium]